MPTRLPLLALSALAVTALGCSGAASPAAPAADTFTPAQGAFMTQPNQKYAFPAGAWRFEVDPATLQASTSPLTAPRIGQFNGDLFGLEIDQFFGGDSLTITGVSINPDLDLVLDIEFAHPFGPPTNLEGPATAGNRADLGVSGQFFVRCDRPPTLVDDELQPNHDGDYQFLHGGTITTMNTKLLENADGFGNPADVSSDGAGVWEDDTNVLHPYIVLVDENDPQCRVKTATGDVIENLNGSAGNYDPVTGWSRANIGSSGQDGIEWTGYGVLHQGQTARRQLVIDLDELDQISFGGSYRFDTCLIANYTDPRQGENGAQLRANRLPTTSSADFAYRMPFGAPDASQITQVGTTIIGSAPGSLGTVTVAIVDEDHAATVNAEFPRPEGAGLQEVPTDSSIVSVTLTIPDLDIIDQAGVIGAGTGTVEDPLIVTFDIVNLPGSTGGIDATNHGFVFVTDADDANGTDPTIWLSPDLSLLPGTSSKKHTKSGHVTLLK